MSNNYAKRRRDRRNRYLQQQRDLRTRPSTRHVAEEDSQRLESFRQSLCNALRPYQEIPKEPTEG